MRKVSILYVEDDVNLSYVTKDNLEEHGFQVQHCTDGAAALAAFTKSEFDLCLLDVMLPALDGFSLAQTIRKTNPHVPILFLTAKSMKEDRLKGFRIGGDDYITKPFSIEELILKIEVFLRRKTVSSEHVKTGSIFELDAGTFDFDNLTISVGIEKSLMTLREAELLRFFLMNPNKVLKREEILNAVWGNDDYFVGRSLDVFISRLRKYLSFTDKIKIGTVHGVGFKLEKAA